MPNTDPQGNKIAALKTKKRVTSANIRQRRMNTPRNEHNRKHCYDCGFRIRGEGHVTGDHHKHNGGKK